MFKTPSLLAASLAAVAGLLAAWGHETDRARSVGKGAEMSGARVERCVTCHVRPAEDPGGAHTKAALGCASCHLGNPLAYQKERAHAGLEREPGALATVERTCGREGCHPREAARISTSLMARASGIVAVDRWVFGEIAAPDSNETMRQVLAAKNPSAGQRHLQKLCGGCHLEMRRANRDDAIRGNGSGCAACHVAPRAPGDAARPHPSIAADVGDDRCFGCHSRSGRVSLSYQGLVEVSPEQAARGEICADPVALPDGRPACRVEPDVHRAAEMACADCHLHTELMGDGIARGHQEQQVEITCESCHGPGGAETTWGNVTDSVTRDLLRVRNQSRSPAEPVRIGSRGTPIWNLRFQDARWILSTKFGSRSLPVKPTPADANHRMKGHERLSCGSCHARSAPVCASCHIRFDPAGKQWDFAAGRETAGAWIETSEGFGSAGPALGVTGDGRIVPAVPGMILDIAREPGSPASARRLFAPIEPHATGRRARTCQSCHSSSSALGLGEGTLRFDRESPGCSPAHPASGDSSLAADGWTQLLPSRPAKGTRAGFRSLNSAEQGRVLVVGACLPCHEKAGDPIWRDFSISIRSLAASRCPFRSAAPPWVRSEEDAAAPRP